MTDFLEWSKSSPECGTFTNLNMSKSWAYADYMYMRDLFQNNPDFSVAELIDWTLLGFEPDEGQDAAIWIGSKSAHTACHYDSYGFNVVYQVNRVMFTPM